MKIVFREGHFYIWDEGREIAGPMDLKEAEKFIDGPALEPEPKKEKHKKKGKKKEGK